MHKLVYLKDDEIEKYTEIFKVGDIPPNFEECSADDFYTSLILPQFSFDLIENRYIRLEENQPMMSFKLFMNSRDKCGYAVTYRYPRWGDKYLQKVFGDPVGGPRYYKFTYCKHQYEVKNLGRCYNRYTCRLCNNSFEVDSGD